MSTTKPAASEPSGAGVAEVVLCNGRVYRGEAWSADGLLYVRSSNGRVYAFGPKAVYSATWDA